MNPARRIREEIAGAIRSGEWRPGDRVPTEQELAARYGCARATVSKALGELAASGLVERRRKAGTFVAHPPVHSAVMAVPDLAELIAARGEAYRWIADLDTKNVHTGRCISCFRRESDLDSRLSLPSRSRLVVRLCDARRASRLVRCLLTRLSGRATLGPLDSTWPGGARGPVSWRRTSFFLR